MKLVTKTIFLVVLLSLTSIALSDPVYEIPTIIKKDNPFNQPYNPRNDNLNDSSANNYKRYLARNLQTHLDSELIRNFSLPNFQKWLDFYESINLAENTMADMIQNVGSIITKSIDIQSYINFRSNIVVKELALLEMKLKQIEALDDIVQNIKEHPGNINTNVGNNLIWKEELDEVLFEATAQNSNYSLAASSICDILDLESKVLKKLPKSVAVRNESIEKIDQHNVDQEFVKVEGPAATLAKPNENLPTATTRNKEDLKRGQELLKEEKKKVEQSFIEKKRSKKNSKVSKSTKKMNNRKRLVR